MKVEGVEVAGRVSLRVEGVEDAIEFHNPNEVWVFGPLKCSPKALFIAFSRSCNRRR